MNVSNRKRIAVIGGGVAGLTAAHLLRREHQVTVFEKNEYPGGHTNTIVLDDGPDAGTAIDTGFIVMNTRNYPLFTKLLDQLGVATQDSDMSFSYHCLETGYQYAGTNMNSLFARRRNFFLPSHWNMISGILRFNRQAAKDLVTGETANVSLGDYLDHRRVHHSVRERYLVPMGSAIWSTPPGKMLDFPANSFLKFFENHGLLTVNDRPQWKTVSGGSHTYVKAMLAGFEDSVRLNSRLRGIRRMPEGVKVLLSDGQEDRFDCCVIATHADQALALLLDPSEPERKLLGAWTYEANDTVFHTDPSHMPSRTTAWASWNFAKEKEGDRQPASVTYHMNRLQNLRTEKQYFVSLNRRQPVPDEHIIRQFTYMHPTYTFASLATQPELSKLNGERNTYYCGSYFGHGFHEDAVRSAVQVAEHFGIGL